MVWTRRSFIPISLQLNKHTAKLHHVGFFYILTYSARKLIHKMSFGLPKIFKNLSNVYFLFPFLISRFGWMPICGYRIHYVLGLPDTCLPVTSHFTSASVLGIAFCSLEEGRMKVNFRRPKTWKFNWPKIPRKTILWYSSVVTVNVSITRGLKIDYFKRILSINLVWCG